MLWLSTMSLPGLGCRRLLIRATQLRIPSKRVAATWVKRFSWLCFGQLGSSAAAPRLPLELLRARKRPGEAPVQHQHRAPTRGRRRGFAARVVFTRVSYFPLRAEMGNSCRPGCRLVPTGTVTQSSKGIHF